MAQAPETNDSAAAANCVLRLHRCRTAAPAAVVVKHAEPVEEALDVPSRQAALRASSAVQAPLAETARTPAAPAAL